MEIRGTARKHRKTKDLVKQLKPGEIAIIDHPDLDQVAAESLIKANVKLVVNASPSTTGRYPNLGPMLLSKAGIPILDGVGEDCFNALPDSAEVEIKEGRIYRQGRLVGEGVILTPERIEEATEEAKKNLNHELDKFIQNTLEYARVEKDLVLGGLALPVLRTVLQKKQVLVVVRGHNYREDLKIILSYIREVKPVLIGVDGGADALIEFGLRPHLIIGDMDSVSDHALRSGAELVVHAYPDGSAPGLKRIQELDLEAVTFPAPGDRKSVV